MLTRRWVSLLVLAGLVLPLNVGCDDFWRDAARWFDRVGDGLNDFADGWDDDDDDLGDWFDQVVNDVEDWF